MESNKNSFNKKVKVTHYLDKQENEMLMQLYTTAIRQNNKKDKSELICKAIRALFKEEVSMLEELSQEKHKQLSEVTKKTEALSALVPLDKQPARVIPFDEAKRLYELWELRNSLEEEVKEIDYLLYQYKRSLA